MKKSFYFLAAIAAIGLAACGPTQPTEPKEPTKPTEVPTQKVDIPTADGKVSFYFELGAGSITFKDYESIWLVGGGINGWKTNYEAYEMQNLAGTSYYYAQVSGLDVTASQGYDYSLVIGYNKKANMPDGSSGLCWVDGRKSNECEAAKGDDGLQNLKFEWSEGQNVVSLGTHTFAKSLPTPTAPLKNYTFKVEFAQPVPEYGKVLLFGSFPGCGWNTPGDGKTAEENKAIIDAQTMKPNADRTVFTLTYESMVAGDYDCKILVEYTTAETSITWNAVDQTKDNYSFSITVADGDNYVLDILGEKATFTLADPNATFSVTVEVYNNGGAMTAAGIGVAGNFNGWNINGNMCELEGEKYVYRAAEVAGAEIQFGVMADSGWADKCVAADGSNITVGVPAGTTSVLVKVTCDWSQFGVAEQHLPAEQIVAVLA